MDYKLLQLGCPVDYLVSGVRVLIELYRLTGGSLRSRIRWFLWRKKMNNAIISMYQFVDVLYSMTVCVYLHMVKQGITKAVFRYIPYGVGIHIVAEYNKINF